MTRTRPISVWFKKNRGNLLAHITENFGGNGFRHGWMQVTKSCVSLVLSFALFSGHSDRLSPDGDRDLQRSFLATWVYSV